jgi:hypothetical protein
MQTGVNISGHDPENVPSTGPSCELLSKLVIFVLSVAFLRLEKEIIVVTVFKSEPE